MAFTCATTPFLTDLTRVQSGFKSHCLGTDEPLSSFHVIPTHATALIVNNAIVILMMLSQPYNCPAEERSTVCVAGHAVGSERGLSRHLARDVVRCEDGDASCQYERSNPSI